MNYQIEDWTQKNLCECKYPRDLEPDVAEMTSSQTLEYLHQLAKFRENSLGSNDRLELLQRIRVDENVFQSTHFTQFGFPHILEHSTLDHPGKIPFPLVPWVESCFERAHLDVFYVEESNHGIQICSLLSGIREPVHNSYFEIPVCAGDYFIGRLFRTPSFNFITFPHMLSEENAKQCVTLLQNEIAKTDYDWSRFMRDQGAVSALAFVVEDLNELLSSDRALPGVSAENLNRLQDTFESLSCLVNDDAIYEGFTSGGWMYAFHAKELPELHIYYDRFSREKMNNSGSICKTKGLLSVFWLPKEAVKYGRFMGNPEWCVAISKKGAELSDMEVNNFDAKILINLIKKIKKVINNKFKFAA